MSKSTHDRPARPRYPSDPDHGETDETVVTGDAEEVLALLSDSHAQTILSAVGDQPLPARELVDRVEASRATVYRRLDRLTEVGLLETVTAYHPEGHHRQEFSLALTQLELSLDTDGVALSDSG